MYKVMKNIIFMFVILFLGISTLRADGSIKKQRKKLITIAKNYFEKKTSK